jgi:hypothetical protein
MCACARRCDAGVTVVANFSQVLAKPVVDVPVIFGNMREEVRRRSTRFGSISARAACRRDLAPRPLQPDMDPVDQLGGMTWPEFQSFMNQTFVVIRARSPFAAVPGLTLGGLEQVCTVWSELLR